MSGIFIFIFRKGSGAWIRFNPLDVKGVKNENVTEFKYALVESDELEIRRNLRCQNNYQERIILRCIRFAEV